MPDSNNAPLQRVAIPIVAAKDPLTGSVPATKARMTSVDENGDAIMRFRIPDTHTDDGSLQEFYRGQLFDLLKIVRLYANGRPVLVDAFAFRNEPERVMPLQSRFGDPES